jgi:hypothetical protein
LSPEVDAVVLRALSKDPEQRYQTAEELALDVERIIELASEAEVGLWIDSVAGEILGKRERLLEEIERLGMGEFSFPADGASSPTHGSITESDTFQRIQSWAEREAARAAADGQASFVPLLDDSEPEPAQTVADARCVDALTEAERSGPVASTSPALKRSAVKGADADEPDSAVTLAEEPSFAVAAAPPLPIAVQGVLGMAAQPAGRGRRWVTILAAAAIVTGMASIAVLSVQPSSVVVSTSGALLPESESSEAEAPVREEPARAAAPATRRAAAEPQDLPIGRAVATVSQVVTESGPAPDPGLEAPLQRTLSPLPAATPPSAAALGQAAADEAAAAERVSLALTQPPKERAQSPLRKTAKRAVAPRRGKPAAPAPKAAASKVDCRQPFWIDEGGIRRLKMACL